MKNFDEIRELRPRRAIDERTFIIGGETFVARDRWRPDVLANLEGIREAETDPTTCSCEHRYHTHFVDGKPSACTSDCSCIGFSAKVLKPGSTIVEQLAAVDATIMEMIEGGDADKDRYRQLRLREDDPLGIDDLLAVVRWATAGDAGRPTGEPGGSTSGHDTTGTPSTAVSSSPVPQTV